MRYIRYINDLGYQNKVFPYFKNYFKFCNKIDELHNNFLASTFIRANIFPDTIKQYSKIAHSIYEWNVSLSVWKFFSHFFLSRLKNPTSKKSNSLEDIVMQQGLLYFMCKTPLDSCDLLFSSTTKFLLQMLPAQYRRLMISLVQNGQHPSSYKSDF